MFFSDPVEPIEFSTPHGSHFGMSPSELEANPESKTSVIVDS